MCSYMNLRQDFDPADVVALTEALWSAVAQSGADLEAQVRMTFVLIAMGAAWVLWPRNPLASLVAVVAHSGPMPWARM